MNVGIDTDFLVRIAILEHPKHQSTVDLRDHYLDARKRLALAPQVLSEFIHVVSDPRRFENPLSIEKALQLSRDWWNAIEIEQIHPTGDAVIQFLDWMENYQLGRERVLDTMLAATYLSSGITHLITGNPRDYRIFPELKLIEM
ncbi:MAG: type II toxin-antitoxin system VapC family toxin [Verrucomicrobia bacterium]|nr:type II toxin-antitoxin system VapC family toxin [Verrucomicrobiota bacterium]